MKKILPLLLVVLSLSELGFSQCGKNLTWTASKAEFLDDSGAVQDTKTVKVTIEQTAGRIKIVHYDDEGDSLAGPVRDIACSWKDPYKIGKSTIKADISEKNGEFTSSVITIEGADSKITVHLQFENNDGRKMHVRIPIDSYQENK